MLLRSLWNKLTLLVECKSSVWLKVLLTSGLFIAALRSLKWWRVYEGRDYKTRQQKALHYICSLDSAIVHLESMITAYQKIVFFENKPSYSTVCMALHWQASFLVSVELLILVWQFACDQYLWEQRWSYQQRSTLNAAWLHGWICCLNYVSWVRRGD